MKWKKAQHLLSTLLTVLFTSFFKFLVSFHFITLFPYYIILNFIIFFYNIAVVERRVRAWLVQRQMQTHLEDLSSIVTLVSQAASEVRASEKLASILKTVLALGSVLNRGTYQINNIQIVLLFQIYF